VLQRDKKDGGTWGHTFILGAYPTTEGEYALSEAMPYVRIIGITVDVLLLCFFLHIGRELD
jgi:hypothetical protein